MYWYDRQTRKIYVVASMRNQDSNSKQCYLSVVELVELNSVSIEHLVANTTVNRYNILD